MSVCCECCVLSGRGLCDEVITRPEESYRLRCVVVCDLETSWMRRPWPNGGGGCCARHKQTIWWPTFGNIDSPLLLLSAQCVYNESIMKGVLCHICL